MEQRTQRQTQACIAGGGPAGLMLGVLLARAGVDVVVIEKHRDFLRDFRGDTIHPSTLELIAELGWLDAFLELPHHKVARLYARFGDERLALADFSRLPVKAPFIAMMPQWDFLNFLAEKGRRYPGFHLMMETEATGLIESGERISGVQARTTSSEAFALTADLVIAADGRDSTLRARSGLPVEDVGAPMDVLWFRLSRAPTDTAETQARFEAGRIFIMLNRGDYWQCAFVIGKGLNERVRAAGLPAFRAALAPLLPFAENRADEIRDWDQVKLLTVQVNRLTRWWRPGLLCIGDAAHAMSPVGGVGINLAVQDAVAAANILAEPLRAGHLEDRHLSAVQMRRAWPTRLTQGFQVLVQDRVVAPTLEQSGPVKAPWLLRVLTRVPGLDRLPARLIGLGVRPEHIRTPALARPDAPQASPI
jgi:2-polyprenyl-6-methoxyphenol hydroxylase-like FAD-dependent oxidoreductase